MFDISKKSSEGSGCFGTYYKRGRRGLKVVHAFGNVYATVDSLKQSECYNSALLEAANYRLAYKSGVVPRCYGITIVKTSNGFLPAIVLQHVGERLCDVAEQKNLDTDTIRAFLRSKLKDTADIEHQDLHNANIMVDTDGKFYAIDFTPGCTSSKAGAVDAKSVPQYRYRSKPSVIEQEMSMWQKVRQFMESRL